MSVPLSLGQKPMSHLRQYSILVTWSTADEEHILRELRETWVGRG